MAVTQDTRFQHSLKMEPGIDRPQSALARGVQITEFKESQVNPEPIVLEETDLLMEQYLSPRKLRLLTGVDNLDDIHTLEMKVNTSDTSLGNFGALLPNLRQLKISNSTIPYIRDIGSSLRSLHVLWASRCCLIELDGISSMCNLKELYLSYNEISDISPLSMLDQLEILDLEGNNLEDIVQVQYLTICSSLTNLTLEGNPLCVAPSPGEESIEYDYRQAVKKAIPQLKTLDDELLIEGVGSFQKHNVFDDDWAYLEELQKDVSLRGSTESLVSDNSSQAESGNRPSTAALRPNTSYRPGTALRPNTGFRPLSASKRPATMGSVRPSTSAGGRPDSSSGRPSTEGAETSDASDLTLGKVICGNPSKALLSRRRLNPDQLTDKSPKFDPTFHHEPEHTFDPLPDEGKDRSDIVAELKAWKEQHEVRMEKIRDSKKPQVLVVDHDDAVSLSGDSEVDTDDDDNDMTGFSPLRGYDDTATEEQDNNSKMLPSVSSFVPAETSSSQRFSPDINISSDKDTLVKHKKDNTINEMPFKISDLKLRNTIPPPNQRDIVRKSIQGSTRIDSPLGSLKVNSTGLPLPPSASASSGLPRNKGRNDTLNPQPVIRGTQFDKPVTPPAQRPSTARAVLGVPSQSRVRRSLPGLPPKPPAAPK